MSRYPWGRDTVFSGQMTAMCLCLPPATNEAAPPALGSYQQLWGQRQGRQGNPLQEPMFHEKLVLGLWEVVIMGY